MINVLVLGFEKHASYSVQNMNNWVLEGVTINVFCSFLVYLFVSVAVIVVVFFIWGGGRGDLKLAKIWLSYNGYQSYMYIVETGERRIAQLKT